MKSVHYCFQITHENMEGEPLMDNLYYVEVSISGCERCELIEIVK